MALLVNFNPHAHRVPAVDAARDRFDPPALNRYNTTTTCDRLPAAAGRPCDARRSYYSDALRSRFVLSPPGSKPDCHRHYEALLLGAVPVVLRSPPMVELLRDLPAVFLSSWDDLDEARLVAEAKALDARPAAAYDWRRLTVAYWRRTLVDARRAAARRPLRRVTPLHAPVPAYEAPVMLFRRLWNLTRTAEGTLVSAATESDWNALGPESKAAYRAAADATRAAADAFRAYAADRTPALLAGGAPAADAVDLAADEWARDRPDPLPRAALDRVLAPWVRNKHRVAKALGLLPKKAAAAAPPPKTLDDDAWDPEGPWWLDRSSSSAADAAPPPAPA